MYLYIHYMYQLCSNCLAFTLYVYGIYLELLWNVWNVFTLYVYMESIYMYVFRIKCTFLCFCAEYIFLIIVYTSKYI
jgi:hypothetical protein